jgi:hypothetical protein
MNDRDINDYLDAAEDLEEPIRFEKGKPLPEPDTTEEDWESEGGAVHDSDPFGEANVKQVQLIVQMRTYDTLMAILAVLDEQKADLLHEVHSKGGIVGALPFIDLR